MAAVSSMSPPAGHAAAQRGYSHLFSPSVVADVCQRCDQKVYHVERVGPVNGVMFHRQCFICCICHQHLSLKTYFSNQVDVTDKSIYCCNHCPRVSVHGYDANALGIRSALDVPNVRSPSNVQIRGTGDAPRIDSDAMHIKVPMSAQSNYQRKFAHNNERHHYPAYLATRTKERLYRYQVDLEKSQREEEDRLMAAFHEERRRAAQTMQQELDSEWEVRLHELTHKYQSARKKEKEPVSPAFEQEKDELTKTMTLKLKKKKVPTATLR